MQQRVSVLPGELYSEIPCTIWGTGDDIELGFRKLDKEEQELALTFIAEGGYAGGRVRVLDLLKYVLQEHPALLQQAHEEVSSST